MSGPPQPQRPRSSKEQRFAEAAMQKLREQKKGVSPDDAGEALTSWAQNETVKAICSYGGSEEFWMPIRRQVEEYAGLKNKQKKERTEILSTLPLGIARWRAHQKENWGPSLPGGSDKRKAAALQILSAMIRAQEAELGKPSSPEPEEAASGSSPSSAPVKSEKKAPGKLPAGWGASVPGEESSEEDLYLAPNVMPQEVKALAADQRKCRVVVESGQLRTYDGLYPIDSEGASIRYVILDEGMRAGLYASQVYSLRDAEDALFSRGGGGESGELSSLESDYPFLTSHAQIVGNVIGAGDMVVSDGRITSINNKSGTWQPKLANLAKTLQLLVDVGLLTEDAIVSGKVTVSQYLHKPQGYNVDAGELQALFGGVMSGK